MLIVYCHTQTEHRIYYNGLLNFFGFLSSDVLAALNELELWTGWSRIFSIKEFLRKQRQENKILFKRKSKSQLDQKK